MKVISHGWNKCKRHPFQALFTLLLCVQFAGIVYVNLFQNQHHLGYDASSNFVKAMEMWKQKTLFPRYKDTTALMLDTGMPLAALLYGLTKNVFVSYGIANILTSAALFAVSRSLLKRLPGATYLSVILPLVVLFSPYIVSFENGNPINDLYSLLHVSNAFYAGWMVIGFLCVRTYISLSEGGAKTKGAWFSSAVCVALCFVSGFSSGLAMIAMFLLPLLMVWIVLAGLSSYRHKPLPNASGLAFAIAACASCLFGRVCSAAFLGFTPNDSRGLVGAFDFFQNLGSIYVGFLQLLGALHTFTGVPLFSARGVAFLCNFVVAHVLILALVWAIKKRGWLQQPVDALVYLCIIAFNCFYFAVCWLTYGGPIFELRYLTHIFICMVCLLGHGLAAFDAKVKAKLLRCMVLGAAFVLLLYSNATSILTYNGTTITSETEPVAAAIRRYDSKLVYGVPKLVSRDLRALDTDRVYKAFVGQGETAIDHTGDYLYYLDAGEYRGETLLFGDSGSYDQLPVYLRARFAFGEPIEGTDYNLYVSESHVIDETSGLPETGVAINFPYSPGVAAQHGQYGSDGYFISDGTGGAILLGPNAPVTSGTYRFTLHYQAVLSDTDAAGWFRVTTDSGQHIVGEVEMPASQRSVAIENIVFPNRGETFEHRIVAESGAEIKILYIEIEKSDSL